MTLHLDNDKHAQLSHSADNYLSAGPSTELSEEDKTPWSVMGAGSTEEEGAASTELPSSSNPEGCAGEVYPEGEGDILGGEERSAWVEDEGSSGFSGL